MAKKAKKKTAKRNLKIIWTFARGFIEILWAYFAWMVPYSRHPEKYPLEKRYAKIRKFIISLTKHMRFDFEGKNVERLREHKAALYVANHQSILDPLMIIIGCPHPIKFIAKKEALKTPFAGRVLKAMGSLFLDRDDPRQALSIFADAQKELAAGVCSYGIFPEGTRNRDPEHVDLGEFHPGSLKVGTRAGVPIIPCTQYGDFRIFGTNELNRSELVMLTVHEQILPEKGKKVNTVELTEKIRAEMTEEIHVMREKDKAYMASKKSRHKGRKWWKEHPEVYA
jgi:1-acyl-sn-glycerol-3-phosphate acyltransferase